MRSNTETSSSSVKTSISHNQHEDAYISYLDTIPNVEKYRLKDGTLDYDGIYHKEFPLRYIPHEERQSFPLPNSDKEGYSSVYRHAYSIKHGALFSRLDDNTDTLLKMCDYALQKYKKLDCLGKRELVNGKFENKFTFKTYGEIESLRDNLAKGIKSILPDYSQNEEHIISLYSFNKPEWVIAQLASQKLAIPTTSLYDTLGPQTSKYILDFTKSEILFLSIENIMKIIKLQSSEGLPFLKYMICMDSLANHSGLVQLSARHGLTLMDLNQLAEIGRLSQDKTPNRVPDRHSLLCISFTSGTTGNPKGVEITHEMATGGMVFTLAHIEKGVANQTSSSGAKEQYRTFCFLPLAHIYELMTTYFSFICGNQIAFPHDPSPLCLVENLKIFKPHVACLVPRVFNKFENALKDNLSHGGVAAAVAKSVIKRKEDRVTNNDGDDGHMAVADSLIISKLREALGFSQVSFAVSGSAPIGPETINFLKSALNIGFKQGYGLTESFSGISISQSFENVSSSGPPGVATEIRLKDIPDMNYFTHDPQTGEELAVPRGELQLRGAQLFPRYYKNPEATEESHDEDGWFKTGDVAMIDERGRIHIIDRVKNFFKLSQGEYISAEKIENVYSSNNYFLQQIFVHGDSTQNYLVAVVGIDPLNFGKIASKLKINKRLEIGKQLEQINKSKELKRRLLDIMNGHVMDELNSFERIYNFRLYIEPLTDCLTPTFKTKRQPALAKFKGVCDELYKEGNLVKSSKL
ncbi:hypothetical protein WICPIJ_007203 [Wickerhamomyces pijperi]|uniref:AMP-dependent synthetase/ligase domain-containing protein n=1 Tax=Wickerhamomyces pijperi TaxID=599730 RepID=A0A9P8Q0B7_WICPI|nr:hypothetical protein WICPIJ_007203 [Wickerhamomyces pijperi]